GRAVTWGGQEHANGTAIHAPPGDPELASGLAPGIAKKGDKLARPFVWHDEGRARAAAHGDQHCNRKAVPDCRVQHRSGTATFVSRTGRARARTDRRRPKD